MDTVFVTGPIGSGKSAVCALLQRRGIPVYDSDRRAKALYSPSLVARLEEALGTTLSTPDGSLDAPRLSALIFSSSEARQTLEGILYPLVREDFIRWREEQNPSVPFVVLESAVILSKKEFDGLANRVVLVTAPEAVRLRRVVARSGLTPGQVLDRMSAQQIPEDDPRIDAVICNTGSREDLADAVKRAFKLDENSLPLYR